MRHLYSLFEKGTIASQMLVAGLFLGFMSILGIAVFPGESKPDVDMYIESKRNVVPLDETFEIKIIVRSVIPVNVFSGELHFNQTILAIESIDYNTSIADLWAERPWYSNGEGTMNFGGGTTQRGGFQGTDTLIKATFKTLKEGEGVISIDKRRVLLHDGFGTDAELAEAKDTVFFVENPRNEEKNQISGTNADIFYKVGKEVPSTDLNGDGKQTIADISMFILNMNKDNDRYDFNLDGKVNIKDLNILLGTY